MLAVAVRARPRMARIAVNFMVNEKKKCNVEGGNENGI